ncbi:MAG: HdeD family acid-resistance protein [Planctomycetia bacterium]
MTNQNENSSPVESLQSNWGWFLALGISLVVVGALAVCLPAIATEITIFALGWLLIVGGVIQAIHAFTAGKWGGTVWELLTAILYGVVGILLLANPVLSMFALTIFLVAFLLIEGLFQIVTAFQVRNNSSWGWVLFSGVVAIILAGMIWSNMPGDALWVLGLLVGVNIIFSGWGMTMVALAARDETTQTTTQGQTTSTTTGTTSTTTGTTNTNNDEYLGT